MSNSLRMLGLISGTVMLLAGTSCEPRKSAKIVTVAKVDQSATLQPPAVVPTELKPNAVAADTVENKLERALLQKTRFEFSEVPLKDVVRRLEEQHELPMRIDEQKLLDEGVQVEQPITLSVSDITLRSALRLLLRPLQLTYVIRAESIVITTATSAADDLETRIYDVERLVRRAGENEADFQPLIDVITATVQPDTWDTVGGESSLPELPPSFLVIRQTQHVHAEIGELLRNLEYMLSVPDAQAPAMEADSPNHVAERMIREKLRQPASVHVDQKPLGTVLTELSKATGTPFWIDVAKLTDEGVQVEQPVSFHVSDIRLESLLDLFLRPLQLSWIIEDEMLKITTITNSKDKLSTRVYDARDLVKQAHAEVDAQSPLLISVPSGVGHGVIFRGWHGSQAVMGSGFGGEYQIPDDRGSLFLVGRPDESCRFLRDAIHPALAPDSWDNVGGEGTMSDFRGLLVVRQTYQNHLDLRRLLEELRNKHRQRPAIAGRQQPSSSDYLLFVIYDVGDHPAEELAKILPEFVAPETWQSANGKGLIRATKGRLLVQQTRRVHQQLLTALDCIVERTGPAAVAPANPSPPVNQPAAAKPAADQSTPPATGTAPVKP